jgi:DNA-binding response OmpR family regulator
MVSRYAVWGAAWSEPTNADTSQAMPAAAHPRIVTIPSATKVYYAPGLRRCFPAACCVKLKAMRILIVEDEKRIADFLSRGLQGAGYAVDTAPTGSQALECIHSTDYDLVILDLMLPDMDGLQVLQRVRSRQPGPPTLILSARGGLDDRVKGLEQGADDYLVKPFAFVELLARVRALLRRGQPAPEKLQVSDLTLDCIRRKVSRAGETIELAPKEFGILEYMMRNKGRPLSRTMIVEHVWDMDYDGLTNIVDVYIRHLRSKIDDRFSLKLIQTVRGIGYMIEGPDRPAERPAEPAAERQV